MTKRQDLQSKLLANAVAEMNKPEFPGSGRGLREFLSDPCNWREPVYAWLLANLERVLKVRYPKSRNPMTWCEIARIMELEGVKGSRGDPPNANSVRRVWHRVCADFKARVAREEADRKSKNHAA